MSSQAQATPPPHAVVMQMVMGAWVSQTISSVTRAQWADEQPGTELSRLPIPV